MSVISVFLLSLTLGGHPVRHQTQTVAAECVDCALDAVPSPRVAVKIGSVVQISDLGSNLTSEDTPEINFPVPYGPLTVLFDYPEVAGVVEQPRSVQLLINGKAVSEPQPVEIEHLAQVEFNLYSPPLGRLVIQCRALLEDGRWTAVSRPIHLEMLRPNAPQVIGIGSHFVLNKKTVDAQTATDSGYFAPAGNPPRITGDSVIVRFANCELSDQIIAQVDDNPAYLMTPLGDMRFSLSLSDVAPGPRRIQFTRRVSPSQILSETSKPIDILFQPSSDGRWRHRLIAEVKPEICGNETCKECEKPKTESKSTSAKQDILNALAFRKSYAYWRIVKDEDEDTSNALTDADRAITFPDPAHFPDRRFGPRGETWEREGALIYEGMKITWSADGQYEVAFVVEAPSQPTTLRLQFEIRTTTCENGLVAGVYTLTLPPIGLEHSEGRTDGKSYSWVVRQRGYSPILRSLHPTQIDIRRTGTARFGFATTVETNQ